MNNDLSFVFKKSFTALIGVIPLGMAFGMLVYVSGFAWWWTPVFSILIYAGSSEFLALGFLMTGISPISAIFSGFIVNFRHIFYGLTVPIDRIKNKFARLYSVYSMTDECYAVYSHGLKEWSGRRMFILHAVLQFIWVLSGVVGSLGASFLPSNIHGMDFALTALFAVLAYEAYRGLRTRRKTVLAVALSCACFATLFSLSFFLLIALSLFFFYLLASYIHIRRTDAR